MYKDKITLSGVEDVKKISLLANESSAKINLISDFYTVDAKSIMSIFTLDLSKPIEVVINGKYTDELIEAIKEFKS